MAARKSARRSKAEQEFVSEAEEILERLRSGLLDLTEGQRPDGEVDPELLNGLFRSAHSLKGLSGMFGLDGISELAHRLEDVLDRLRMGQIVLDAQSAGLLEESVQLVAGSLTALGDEEAQLRIASSVEELVARIEAWVRTPVLPASDELSELDLDPVILRALTEYEEHRLRESLRRGRFIHVVEVAYEIHSFDQALAELTESIRDVGELLSTLPSPGEDSGSQIRFALLTATDLTAAQLVERLALPEEAARTAYEPGPDAAQQRPAQPAPAAPDSALAGGDIETLKSIGGTVRVDIHKLDDLMNLVGELVIQRRALGTIAERLRSQSGTARLGDELDKIHQTLDRRLQELQAGVLEVRMVPLRQIFEKLSRVVRRLGRDTAKEVRLEIRGADTELDKLIVEELVDPLVHVVRNAFDHAIEPPEERRAAGKDPEGRILVEASQRGNDVLITVRDDGRGIDAEAVWRRAVASGLVEPDAVLSQKERLELVFSPGLTTRSEVTETSGRGVGMDVARANITALGGIVELESQLGEGTVVTMTLPITLAIIQALVVGVADQRFALPLNSVHETLLIGGDEIQHSQGRELLNVRGEALPLRRLAQEFELAEVATGEKQSVVVLGIGELRLGLVVDRLEGQQDAVIKPIQGPLSNVRGIAGATDLGDGGAILVLDVAGLVEDSLRGREAA